jgi:hypothetical protein
LEAGREALALSEETAAAAQAEAAAAVAEQGRLAAALAKSEGIAAHYKKVTPPKGNGQPRQPCVFPLCLVHSPSPRPLLVQCFRPQEKRTLEAEFDELAKASEELERARDAEKAGAEFADMVTREAVPCLCGACAAHRRSLRAH